MRKIIFSMVMMSGVVVSAFSQSTAQPEANQASPTPMAMCPHIPEIKKSPTEGNWTATTKYGFWKSYHRTFSNHLSQFLGAQWVGANVGQVTCIYKADQQFMMNGQLTVQRNFPVLLVYHSLAHQPTGSNWKHVKSGVYNCVSQNQEACTFAINIEAKSGNIFEEAESFKSKQSNSPSPLNTN